MFWPILVLITLFNPEMFVYRLNLDSRMFPDVTNVGPERQRQDGGRTNFYWSSPLTCPPAA